MTRRTYCLDYKDAFAPSDRSRGDQYFRTKRVLSIKQEDDAIVAKVNGSGQVYLVEIVLDRINDTIEDVYCECPQFNRSQSCKHLWAVMRVMDAEPAIYTGQRIATPNRAASQRKANSIAAIPLGKSDQLTKDVPSTETALSIAESYGLTKTETRPTTLTPSMNNSLSALAWSSMLQLVQQQVDRLRSRNNYEQRNVTNHRVPYYLFDLSVQSSDVPRLQIYLFDARIHKNEWHELNPASYRALEASCDGCGPRDQRILRAIVEGNDPDFLFGSDSHRYRRHDIFNSSSFSNSDFELEEEDYPYLLTDLAESGRLYWQADQTAQPAPQPVTRFIAETIQPQIVLRDAPDEQIEMSLELVVSGQAMPIEDVVWFWESGTILMRESIGRIEPLLLPWLLHFMQNGRPIVPRDQRDGLIHALTQLENGPRWIWPESWGLRQEQGVPVPVLKIKWPQQMPRDLSRLQLTVEPWFRYGDQEFTCRSSLDMMIFDQANSRILSRDFQNEERHLSELLRTELLMPHGSHQLGLPFPQLSRLTDQSMELGWQIEAQGKPLTAPRQFSLNVSSGQDWFDLSGGVQYADQIVPIPVLLQAVRRNESFIPLDDGSQGMLPKEWMQKFGRFLELAQVDGESLRFGRSQALLLDMLLTEQEQSEQIQVDVGFRNFRKQLAAFSGISPGKEPKTFRGELREYQREGLGWFGFLQKFGFGGCLADDMGLGKTIQVLALLEQRRARRLKKDEVRKPSLVVVPKSLIFNWVEEAAKFAPKLNVVDYTGIGRKDRVEKLDQCDVVLTTYGTLRKDITRLAAMQFDYAILDEAQAIKNCKTDSAKACYLLQAEHRLAMTGTPIENHLGDLWSQFRFLNPGLLGHSEAFAAFNRADCQPESLKQLSQAIRPFLLRRTKQEVLKELPDKTEQTLFCEMGPKQARQYNELRDHFRLKLGKTVAELGIKRSKIHVLDALLKLRQTACDGRLVNSKQGARGVKLDMLVEQLTEVMEDGHKVLVFSQFTSLLALVQQDLKKRKIPYEYLDGKTTNRKSKVHHFQENDEVQLFLISLKAGGHGLNLTAADYVYILDPWWNPAAEAQAIDRAHRIGQTKNVFAYRMITKGTVEEKIMELQKTKRELADSIISGNSNLIRNLTADDLQMLLG